MSKKANIPNWIKTTLKFFIWSVVVLVIMIGSSWLFLQTETVQNFITKKGLSWLSEKTDHDFSLDRIKIDWFDEIAISEFELKDYQDSTLVNVETIELNYDLWKFIESGKLELEELRLTHGKFNLIDYIDTTALNLTVFLNSLENLKSNTQEEDSVSSNSQMVLGHIYMENVMLSIHDLNADAVDGKLDLSNVDFNLETLEVNDLSLKTDSISLAIKRMTGEDKRNQIRLDNFETKVGFTYTYLILDDLSVVTPHSRFGDSLIVNYSSPADLFENLDSAQFYVNINNSKVGVGDVLAFSGSDQLRNDVYLDMILDGTLGNLKLTNATIKSGSSKLHMDASLVGLPIVEKIFVDFTLDKSQVFKQDFQSYLGKDMNVLEGIDWLDLNFSLSGFINDFSTKGQVKTNFGGIKGDLNITIPDDMEMTAYTGHLELDDLHVGRLIGDTSMVQQVSLKGRILGKGITPEKASFLTDFVAWDIGLKNYVYDSLNFKGYLAAEKFYGKFGIFDPNCKISGRTDVDLRTMPEQLSLSTRIDTLLTKNLNLTEQDFALSSTINWSQKHLNPDSLMGNLAITDTYFSMDTIKTFTLSSLYLETNLEGSHRTVNVEMPGVKLELDGNYTFKNLAIFMQNELTDLMNYFELGSGSEKETTPVMDAQLTATLGNLNPYMDYFASGIVLSDSIDLRMSFEQKEGSDAIVSMNAYIDSLAVSEDVFIDNEVDLYTSMDPSSEKILGSFLVASREQRWKAIPKSKDLLLEGVWLDDRIELHTYINQPETNTKADIQAEVWLSSDSIKFHFEPSELVALGRSWTFDPNNYINLSKRGLLFRSFDLMSGDKRASINGRLSESDNSSVSFLARNIDLHQFNSVLNIPVEGVFNADFMVFKVPEQPVQLEGDFSFYEFEYKENLIGDIKGKAFYHLEKDGISAEFSVARENFEAISMKGYYYPEKSEQLDFVLSFDNADFKMLEVVTEESLSDLDGQANGEIKIKGSTEAPKITGFIDLEDIQYKIEYTQSVYNMNGTIFLEEEEIELKDFILRDPDGDIATLKGGVKHKNFGDIITDLHIKARNFNFLNTASRDNELYYGTANATGDIFINGPFSDLLLKINVKTEKGTKFYIPLSDSESYEQAEFLTFVNLSDTTRNQIESVIEEESGLGLTIDFDLEVTNDAYCELIFDIKTGDIIRGRGTGNLKLKLDKNGNFELFGPLSIEEGGYNFTLNFINKEFQVESGSTITWYGDPYSGSMDLTATYSQKAAFSGLIGESGSGELDQKLPVIVKLNMSGQMLAPTIDFDIALDESVMQSQEITGLLAQVRGDEQQLKRQVVSLLFLKRFSPLQDGFVGGGGSGAPIGKSLSEFLTNQISYLASQLDENLEVEVDLSDLDDEGFDTFQLRLAYTFMDGRLKVSRGGDFTSATSEENNLANDIIGDWSVEYMLTKDGKLRAKMFSQSSQSQVGTDGQQSMETGLSLKYVTSFNKFGELLRRSRTQAIQRKEEEATAEEVPEDSGTE